MSRKVDNFADRFNASLTEADDANKVTPDPNKALSFGKLIRKIREARGLNQTELARKIGGTPSFINMLEADGRTMSLQNVQDLAIALGIERQYLEKRWFYDNYPAIYREWFGSIPTDTAEPPPSTGEHTEVRLDAEDAAFVAQYLRLTKPQRLIIQATTKMFAESSRSPVRVTSRIDSMSNKKTAVQEGEVPVHT